MVKWPVAGQAVGIVTAALLLASINEVIFGLVFALLLILAVMLTSFQFRLAINPVTGGLCGFISGFSGTVVAIGGPPMALLFHSLPAKSVLTNLSSFFLVGCLMALVALALVNELTLDDGIIALKLLPGLILGFNASRFLRNRINPAWVKNGALILSGLVGVYLLLRYGMIIIKE